MHKIIFGNKICYIIQNFQENLGRIELLDSIKNTYTILKGRGTFRYKLHFPIQNPVPWINSIELSGRQICVGSSGKQFKSLDKYFSSKKCSLLIGLEPCASYYLIVLLYTQKQQFFPNGENY